LPPGFEWSTIDLKKDDQIKEVYELLTEHYVEDKDHKFRFDYPIEFLRWALLVSGYKQEWHLGVRITKTGKLFGFISGIPVNMNLKG
jgi:glycylpeptide N-tetradecanoyltransferase